VGCILGLWDSAPPQVPLPLTRLADEKDRTGVISKDGEVSVVLDVL
jgi:hypothetical protein